MWMMFTLKLNTLRNEFIFWYKSQDQLREINLFSLKVDFNDLYLNISRNEFIYISISANRMSKSFSILKHFDHEQN